MVDKALAVKGRNYSLVALIMTMEQKWMFECGLVQKKGGEWDFDRRVLHTRSTLHLECVSQVALKNFVEPHVSEFVMSRAYDELYFIYNIDR